MATFTEELRCLVQELTIGDGKNFSWPWLSPLRGWESPKMTFIANCFSIRVFFHRHWQFTGQQGKGGDDTLYHLEYTLPLPPAHEPWDLYLQLCMWNDYHVFLVATFELTRLLLDEIDHIIKLPFWLIDWLIDDAMFVYLLDKLILSFCYSDLTCETGGFELALTMTLVLQASRLTKCASHC